jgi:hypothetical protein
VGRCRDGIAAAASEGDDVDNSNPVSRHGRARRQERPDRSTGRTYRSIVKSTAGSSRDTWTASARLERSSANESASVLVCNSSTRPTPRAVLVSIGERSKDRGHRLSHPFPGNLRGPVRSSEAFPSSPSRRTVGGIGGEASAAPPPDMRPRLADVLAPWLRRIRSNCRYGIGRAGSVTLSDTAVFRLSARHRRLAVPAPCGANRPPSWLSRPRGAPRRRLPAPGGEKAGRCEFRTV